MIINLKLLRKKQGLTQKQIAERLGVTRQTINNLEKNPKQVMKAIEILDAYGWRNVEKE